MSKQNITSVRGSLALGVLANELEVTIAEWTPTAEGFTVRVVRKDGEWEGWSVDVLAPYGERAKDHVTLRVTRRRKTEEGVERPCGFTFGRTYRFDATAPNTPIPLPAPAGSTMTEAIAEFHGELRARAALQTGVV